MSEIRFTNLERVLNDYGLRVVDKYRKHLAAPKMSGKVRTVTNASGTLSRLVHPVLEQNGDQFELYVDFGVEYWQWLEHGTRLAAGHNQGLPPGRAMKEAIRKWIDVKPVIPYKGSNGRIPTKSQLVFLITRKIYRDGTPPLRFLEQSLESEDAVYELCRQAVLQDIDEFVKEILEG